MICSHTDFFLFKEEFLLRKRNVVLIGLSDSSYCMFSNSLFSGNEKIFYGNSVNKSLLQNELENYNFFCSEKDIVLYKAEEFKQGESLLEAYFQKPNCNYRLIIFTEKKSLFDLLVKVGCPSTLLILNLIEEKSYQKTKRLHLYLQSYLQQRSIHCSLSTLQEFLFLCSGLSHERILKELDRLICFVGERKTIVVRDIREVANKIYNNSFWEIRDLILKRQRNTLLNLFIKNEKFYKDEPLTLIAFLRSQMLFGLNLLAKNDNIEDKRRQLFSNYGSERLKAATDILFRTEQNIKSGKLSHIINLELLFIHLTKTL